MKALGKFLVENGLETKTSFDKDVFSARIALYGAPDESPQVQDISGDKLLEFVENLTADVYTKARNLGSPIPYRPVREVLENLIHADFREVTVSILDGGCTLVVSDRGPGIKNPDKALLPGFTTACKSSKKYIRGLGSGLWVAKNILERLGGSLKLDDNLAGGSVVTLRAPSDGLPAPAQAQAPAIGAGSIGSAAGAAAGTDSAPDMTVCEKAVSVLNDRQRKILLLVAELESAGPSLVANELGFSLTTAYRDLAMLEQELGLLANHSGGKRTLTETGINCLDYIFDF